jgi:NTP pyrophosphatase (non-canonical NTP hydrolase)
MWEMQRLIENFDRERFEPPGPGFLALSLAGEAGELANFMKKVWRKDTAIGRGDGFSVIDDGDKKQIAGELADVVMLSLVLASHLSIDIEVELGRKLELIDERLKTGYYGAEGRS